MDADINKVIEYLNKNFTDLRGIEINKNDECYECTNRVDVNGEIGYLFTKIEAYDYEDDSIYLFILDYMLDEIEDEDFGKFGGLSKDFIVEYEGIYDMELKLTPKNKDTYRVMERQVKLKGVDVLLRY